MFNRNTGIVLLVALAAGLGLLLGQKFLGGTPSSPWPPTKTITFYPQPRPLPQFSLRQSDGTQLVPGELKGHWTLVFLGFTFCPDVCPTTLTDLAVAQQQWQSIPDGLRPRVLFVSVDPQRDPPKRLGEYAHAFHKDTLAATADVPALERFATALGFVFQKVPGKNFDQNPNDYSMDHSAGIAVLDPQGRLAGLIRPPLDPKAIAADLQQLTKVTAP
ncbi:SCO family protein [Xanthomonas melonis]|uniref:SCO family protein n=1 Tax=Xanthomonas melonis TaxID=56456 RepID=A0ABS8NTA4_9XANT|nr:MULTISPECIES: SCO family protein [Xanthomonas]MCC4587385.1 SCO family protein [Xanthomonas sp. NCPPB 1067]MCD0247802.1 SCO family protein [Xanthomonas melonis]MCD0257350.1 SCO family protein [Xanthomonas melonis]MCD0265525.1 SCO family protein [Xanthomonas melonis]MCD0280122.1 SCO family protein [Xanthomonas melonis]